MFYNILREITATVFKVYFRKIYVLDKNKVPKTGPILLACNHPMAFSEACLLACFLDRPLHFLVRGDVFKSQWKWFFKWTHQVPIYRFRDGFSNMRKNADSFKWVHKTLKNGKVILIFSEGNTKFQKKLAPLQKGTAKIAFGAYENAGTVDLKIVPVGVNYSDGTSFRSDVMVKVGDPLSLSDYLKLYSKDHHEAIRLLTEDLSTALLPQVLHIEKGEDEIVFNKMSNYFLRKNPEKLWPILDTDPTRFYRERNIANKLNSLSGETKQSLHNLLIKDQTRGSTEIGILKTGFLMIGAPAALLGFILNAVPFYIAKYISGKKVKQKEFYSPVRMGLLIILYLFWFLIWLLVLFSIFGWSAFAVIWLWPLSGFMTIIWWEGLKEVKQVPFKKIRKIDDFINKAK